MTDRKQLHVIFGTGAAAAAAGKHLTSQGYRVRFINRSGQRNLLLPEGTEVMQVDARQPEQAMAAAAGADVIYNCLNVPYQKWADVLPTCQSNLIAAAEDHHARLVALENLYGYGRVEGPMTEDLPLNASTDKGKLRAQMSKALMEAHDRGRIEVAIGRASDFYGPGVTSSALGERAFGPLVEGRTAQVMGDPDQPHSYAYIEDIGEGLATLGTSDRAFGDVWHLPHAPAISTRDMLNHAFELVAQEPKVNGMGRLKLMIGGLFIPEARESIELLYEFNQPFLVDDAKFRKAFNQMPTAIPTGLQRTVRWYQDHSRP